MFFLFSDILVQAKRCSPIHPTNGDKLACQRIFPLNECTVDKVFGHTKSQGGLISLTFSNAKLLLMSSHQEDINDWYRSLCLAIGRLKTKSTVVHRREELLRPPLRAATHSQQSAPASSQTHSRKRAMASEQGTESSTNNYRPPAGESAGSASKKIKISEAPSGRSSFCFNYCLNWAWHGGDQFVALLRWYGSPGFFDSGLQLICIFLVSCFSFSS
ncbi:hypothetical protein QTP70_018352 [Hemibagrus guttatus]|uniref:PH domain-containing protein n=1 Tax=Hemibagrus guttatus TaxID=175788 RepID=A0AAE0QDE4_9TELE|nr:hypothetical protein QTP70_018352 [Hemibagrus guttatus]